MTEKYCWTNIKCSIDGEHEENIEFVLKTIKDNFSNLFRDKLVDIKIINANYIIIATTCSNHYSDDVREIIKMFYTISQIAIGSYGLIHIRNDEDKTNSNNFKIYKMAKGVVKILDDNLLSPCIPIIEI